MRNFVTLDIDGFGWPLAVISEQVAAVEYCTDDATKIHLKGGKSFIVTGSYIEIRNKLFMDA